MHGLDFLGSGKNFSVTRLTHSLNTRGLAYCVAPTIYTNLSEGGSVNIPLACNLCTRQTMKGGSGTSGTNGSIGTNGINGTHTLTPHVVGHRLI